MDSNVYAQHLQNSDAKTNLRNGIKNMGKNGTSRVAFREPLHEYENQELSFNSQKSSNMSLKQLASPKGSNGEIRQGRKKKFFVQMSDYDIRRNSTPRASVTSMPEVNNIVTGDREMKSDVSNNRNTAKNQVPGILVTGPGPGSEAGDTTAGPVWGSPVGEILGDSGCGSLSIHEADDLRYADDSDSDSASIGYNEGLSFDNDDSSHDASKPLLNGHVKPVSEDNANKTADGSVDAFLDKHFAKKRPSITFSEYPDHVHTEDECSASGSQLGKAKLFTVVNYSDDTSLTNSTEMILPSITKHLSPSASLDGSKSDLLKVENEKPTSEKRRGSYSSPNQSRRGSFSVSLNNLLTNTALSLPSVAKRGLLFAKRKKDRLLDKRGSFNISYKNISNRHSRFLQDLFTTVLDMSWLKTISLFAFAFCITWIGFALLWWLIARIRGDTSLPVGDTHKCVNQVHGWVSALLFSIETQHTIGYGVRAITEDCPEAILLLMIQSMVGVLSQCVVTGFILSKLARPRGRSRTIMFSKNAVICQEDGEYCLLFRVGDMRHSQLVGAMLHAMCIKKRTTQEGNEIPFYQYHLDVRAESEDYDQFIFLSWPIRVIHRITPSSPLWGVSAEQLLTEDFEIIIVLEGVVEATSMTTQVRTSYLPSEILWGHSLKPLLTCRKDNGRYEIDFGRFHQTVPVSMPDYSAEEHLERQMAHMEKSDEQDGHRSSAGVFLSGNIPPPISLVPPPLTRSLMEEQARRLSMSSAFAPSPPVLAEARQRRQSVPAKELFRSINEEEKENVSRA